MPRRRPPPFAPRVLYRVEEADPETEEFHSAPNKDYVSELNKVAVEIKCALPVYSESVISSLIDVTIYCNFATFQTKGNAFSKKNAKQMAAFYMLKRVRNHDRDHFASRSDDSRPKQAKAETEEAQLASSKRPGKSALNTEPAVSTSGYKNLIGYSAGNHFEFPPPPKISRNKDPLGKNKSLPKATANLKDVFRTPPPFKDWGEPSRLVNPFRSTGAVSRSNYFQTRPFIAPEKNPSRKNYLLPTLGNKKASKNAPVENSERKEPQPGTSKVKITRYPIPEAKTLTQAYDLLEEFNVHYVVETKETSVTFDAFNVPLHGEASAKTDEDLQLDVLREMLKKLQILYEKDLL